MDSTKFHRAEAKVSGQRNRVQPELCRLIVAIHMDMGRLVRLMAVKIHAVWPHHQYGWHATSISPRRADSRSTLSPGQSAAERASGKRGKYNFPLCIDFRRWSPVGTRSTAVPRVGDKASI